jgi:hypothetical protein
MKAVDDTLLLQYDKTHSRHEIHERIYIENITDMIMMAQGSQRETPSHEQP